ncbi:hypothetical protein VTK26DRAFT_7335 [Humicola hyalothermophila]
MSAACSLSTQNTLLGARSMLAQPPEPGRSVGYSILAEASRIFELPEAVTGTDGPCPASLAGGDCAELDLSRIITSVDEVNNCKSWLNSLADDEAIWMKAGRHARLSCHGAARNDSGGALGADGRRRSTWTPHEGRVQGASEGRDAETGISTTKQLGTSWLVFDFLHLI